MDTLIATTGYHRKYAIRVLKQGYKPKGKKKPGRQKIYQGEGGTDTEANLENLWTDHAQKGCIHFYLKGSQY